MQNIAKYLGKHPKYKYVYIYQKKDKSNTIYYIGRFQKGNTVICRVSELNDKQCALVLDKKLIELGYEPINILKRK